MPLRRQEREGLERAHEAQEERLAQAYEEREAQLVRAHQLRESEWGAAMGASLVAREAAERAAYEAEERAPERSGAPKPPQSALSRPGGSNARSGALRHVEPSSLLRPTPLSTRRDASLRRAEVAEVAAEQAQADSDLKRECSKKLKEEVRLHCPRLHYPFMHCPRLH